MSDPVIQAVIATSGAVTVSITALFLNYRGFTSIERRIEILEKDFKEFYKTLISVDNRVEKLENKGK